MSNVLPNGVNVKFDQNGNALPFEGSTVIGYFNYEAFYQALGQLTTAISADKSLMSKLILLPASSYHVTVFDCVCQKAGGGWYWPSGVPRETPLYECMEILKERFSNIALNELPDINLKITGHKPFINTLAVTFSPNSGVDVDNLKCLRDSLSILSGIRRSNHETYEFHLTIGYFIDQVDFSDMSHLEKLLSDFFQRIDGLNDHVTLNKISFCSFKDMLSYHPELCIK